MIDLKDYLLNINESKETYYICYSNDLESAETLDDVLSEIEPEYVLKSSDYNDEDDEIRVNGSWEFYPSENTNYYNDKSNTPRRGDLVFKLSDVYSLYRPGLNTPSPWVEDDALVGTREEIENYLLQYSKELSSDYNCDIKKLLGK